MCLPRASRNLPGRSASRDTNMSINSCRPRMVFGVNSSLAVGFLQGQLQYFQRRGFDVTVLCPKPRRGEWEVPRPEGISVVAVPMEREIAPLRDLVSLCRLWRTIRALRPAVTNVGTPKAGLLGGFAAWVNRVPCRFYTLHGLLCSSRCMCQPQRTREGHCFRTCKSGAYRGFGIRQL